MMTSHADFNYVPRCLGKKAPRFDKRTLKLEHYLQSTKLPPTPASLSWSGAFTNWGMMKNDSVGDCTCAGAGHAIQIWTYNANYGQAVTIPDAEVLKAYTAITAEENNGQGYNPQTGANDNGCVEIDVLNYWRQTGIGGHKIDAYAFVNPFHPQMIREAIMLFGGVYIGLSLPITAQDQIDQGVPWSVPRTGPTGNAAPGSWGGHCVFIDSYDPKYLTCVTWGALQKMTWNFWYCYCDEAYAIISKDFIEQSGKSPSGFDMAALTADLTAVTK